jgi:hypothetical protein
MANPRDAGVPEVVEFFPVITEQVKVFCQTVDENPGLHRLTEHAPPQPHIAFARIPRRFHNLANSSNASGISLML